MEYNDKLIDPKTPNIVPINENESEILETKAKNVTIGNADEEVARNNHNTCNTLLIDTKPKSRDNNRTTKYTAHTGCLFQ